MAVPMVWAALVALSPAGDKLPWALGVGGMFVLVGLTLRRPLWGACACLALSAASFFYLHGWRDPLNTAAALAPENSLAVRGFALSMDAMQASFYVAVACAILFSVKRWSDGMRRFALPLAPFFAIVLLSWIVNGARPTGMRTAIGLMTPWLFAVAIYGIAGTRRSDRALETSLYAGIALSIVVGVLAAHFGGKPLFKVEQGQWRFAGAMAPPGFARACIPALGLLFARGVTAWRPGRAGAGPGALAWLGVVAVLLLINSTLTRVLIFACYLALAVNSLAAPRRRLLSALLTVLACTIALAAFWAKLDERTFPGEGVVGRLARAYTGHPPDTPRPVGPKTGSHGSQQTRPTGPKRPSRPRFHFSGRRLAWQQYWSMAREHMVLGNGPGQANERRGEIRWVRMPVPHNEYLRLMVETGALGTLAFVGGLGYVVWLVVVAARGSGRRGHWGRAAMLCVTVLVPLAFAQNVLYDEPGLCAVLAVVAVALRRAADIAPSGGAGARGD